MGVYGFAVHVHYLEPQIVELAFSVDLHVVVRLAVYVIYNVVEGRAAHDEAAHDIAFAIHPQTFCTASSEITTNEELAIRLSVHRVGSRENR